MKVEIAGHRCGFCNRSAGEVVSGCVTTAFQVEISLRGVNGAIKGTVAGETDRGVAGQAIIGKVFCLGGIVGDAIAADGRGGARHVNRQAPAGSDVDLRWGVSSLGAAATGADGNTACHIQHRVGLADINAAREIGQLVVAAGQQIIVDETVRSCPPQWCKPYAHIGQSRIGKIGPRKITLEMAGLETGAAAVHPRVITDRTVGADGSGDALYPAGRRAYVALQFSIPYDNGIGIGRERHHVAIAASRCWIIRSNGTVKAIRADVIPIGVKGLLDDHRPLDGESRSGPGLDEDSPAKGARADRPGNVALRNDDGVGTHKAVGDVDLIVAGAEFARGSVSVIFELPPTDTGPGEDRKIRCLDAAVEQRHGLFDAALGDDDGLVPILRTADERLLRSDQREAGYQYGPQDHAGEESNGQGATLVNERLFSVYLHNA